MKRSAVLLAAAVTLSALAPLPRTALAEDVARDASPASPSADQARRPSLFVIPFGSPTGRRGTVLAAEKQRVPKPENKPKVKEEEKKQEDETSSSNCFFDCLGGLFSSSSSEPTPVAVSAPSVYVPPLPAWTIGEDAVIHHRSEPRGAVTVWDGPGGDADGQAARGTLPSGARVRIIETHTMVSGLWLKVDASGVSGPSGWIHAMDIVPPGTLASEAPERPPVPEGRPLTGVWLSSIGWGKTGPRDIEMEYKWGGVRVSSQYAIFPARNFVISGGLGYQYMLGTPRFDYVTEDTVARTVARDLPSRSRLQVLDIGIRAGQYLTLGYDREARVFWAIGPMAGYVKEKATIDFTRSRNDTLEAIGTRVDELSRWRLGVDVSVGAMASISSRGNLGLLLRGFFLPWKSDREKSLTFDFIDKKTVSGFDIALVFGLESR